MAKRLRAFAFLFLGWLATAPASAEDSIAFVNGQGEVVSSYTIGTEVMVRLERPDLDETPAADSSYAYLLNLSSYEAEYLSLLETGPETGVFVGSMPLLKAPVQSYNHALSALPGDQLQVGLAGLFATAEATALSLVFVDAQGLPTEEVTEEGPARVRMLNVFANTDPESAETVSVEIEALFTEDTETLELTETGPDTNLFTGAIAMQREPYSFADGILQVYGSSPSGDQPEVLTVRYETFEATALTVLAGPPNQAPELSDDGASTLEDQPVTLPVLANDFDPDGDVLRVVAVTSPNMGTAAIDPGEASVTYTPAPNASGFVYFQVTVSDPEGLEAISQVFLGVFAVNDAPVAVDDEAATPEDTPVLVEIRGNDSDVDSEVFYPSSATTPAHGTLQLQVGGAFYTPDPGFSGVDTFAYTLVDGEGATDTAVVTVTVTPVAPPRVTANLQVLYELEEGSGTTVADTSWVGTPLNLTIGSPSAVTWIPGGLSVDSPTLIQSATSATKVISAIKSTHSVTLEAWVEPANTTQTGPAPIVTVSQTSAIRNFTLGQNGNRWETRVRTSNTNPTGYGHNTPVGSATTSLTHVVYTRDAANPVKLYINGVQVLNGYVTGTFATWPTNQKLGLGAELNGANPWLGKLYLVAVYNRALTAAEVQQNWEAGE